MTAPLHIRPLVASPRVQVDDICCGASRSPLGDEEGDPQPRLVLPRRGVFSIEAGGEIHMVEPGCMLVLAPDSPYRFGHPADGGDDCVRIALAPATWSEFMEFNGLEAVRVTHTRQPLTGRQLYLNALFCRAAAALADDEPNAVEELALNRVASLLATMPEAALPVDGPRSRSSRRALVEAAGAYIAAHHSDQQPNLLDSVAAAVHSSPFHLARSFRRHTGLTLHQYRERLRCNTALLLLVGTDTSLAEMAHELGYANHSHFSASFRRMCGATPSAARSMLRRAKACEVRKILTAHEFSAA